MNALDRLRQGRSGEDGFTLVELLVTMLITGIVLSMIGVFFANISRLTSWSGKDRDATGQAALALDAVRAVVRVATNVPKSTTETYWAIQYGTPTQLQIIAYSNTSVSDSAPVLVTFNLGSDGTFTEQRQAATMSPLTGFYAFNGSVTKTTIANGFVASGAETPFFQYLDQSFKPLNASPKLSDADRQNNVTLIRVTTTLDPTTAGGPDGKVIVTSSIGMPNLDRDVVATASVPNLPTPTETPTPTPTVTKSSSAPAASPTPTTGASSGGSGTGTGTGSGPGTGPGTSTPTTGTGGGGTGSTGGGSGTSTPAPSSSSPKPTATATPTPKPTATAKPPVVIDQ
ncbi:type II secretion system protein [Amnibacterium kyonggiense]|uniref:Prepilin-type N-terminal cleavage/methylation domain-containing protein n=1 Tax=Amnibacterium kyonggiense TaxID=595671 RepID=A0A4R7FQW8_9MICO|nr:type II secretion system protein [Amnibacterium kyonggiense]TDS80106.1 prepilin-type N-terminal cleavage/methylation domain-containing protein [Amnibacterium kyonggiense]